MKKLYFTSILSILAFIGYSQSFEWAFPTKGLQVIKAGIGSSNAIYVAASFHDSCTVNDNNFYTAGQSVLILKLNPEGHIMWSRTISGVDINLKSLQINGNEVFIAGDNLGSLTGFPDYEATGPFRRTYVLGFSTMGNIICFRAEGGSTQVSLKDMAISNNKVVVTGMYSGANYLAGIPVPATTNNSIYIITYDLITFASFVTTITGTDLDVRQVKTDQADNVFLKVYLEDSISVTGDTSFYLNPWEYQYVEELLKLSSTGHLIKIEKVGGYVKYLTDFIPNAVPDYRIDLLSEGCNHCTSGGRISMSIGDLVQWSYHYGAGYDSGAPGEAFPPSMNPLMLSSSGENIYFTGRFRGPLYYGNDSLTGHGMFLSKIDNDGQYQFFKALGTNLFPAYLSNPQNGSLVLTGFFTGSADFDSIHLNTVSEEGFIAKFNDFQTTCISLNSNKQDACSIYPNPSSALFTLQLNQDKNSTICIYDMLGNCIQKGNISNASTFYIDLTGYSKGIYFVDVDNGKEKVNKKIVLN